jgi:hypothetical protein
MDKEKFIAALQEVLNLLTDESYEATIDVEREDGEISYAQITLEKKNAEENMTEQTSIDKNGDEDIFSDIPALDEGDIKIIKKKIKII